eukprot:scaffold62506_cov24-Tisochrysis_lutea.AAC.1
MRFSFQPLLVFRAMQNQMTGIGQSVQSWQARERERERGVSRGEKAWMKAHRDEGKVTGDDMRKSNVIRTCEPSVAAAGQAAPPLDNSQASMQLQVAVLNG